MKLEEKKFLDISYTFLGIVFYYFKVLVKLLGFTLRGFNKAVHISDKNSIKSGLDYNRSTNYFDVDLSSSGTTGEPTTVWASPLHWISEQSAQMEYFSSNGYRFRDKMVVVRGYAPKAEQHFIKRDRLRNFVWISPFHLKKENLKEIIAELSGRYFLRGYPSSLELLANLIKDHKISYPVASFTASETLSKFQRNKIEATFKCKVFDWYGTSEPAVLLFQDKNSYPAYREPLFHCKTRMDTENSEEAKIYGTSIWDTLSNLGYYDTGDTAILEDKKVIAIKGRSSDVVRLNDLNIPVTNFLTVFYGCPGVIRFQIVNFKDIVLFIVQSDSNFDEDWLFRELDKRLCKDNFTINQNLDFIQSKLGKTPHFINKISVSYNEFLESAT